MSLLNCQNDQSSSGSILFKKQNKKKTHHQTTTTKKPPKNYTTPKKPTTKTILSERNSPFSALGWGLEGHLNNGFPVISNLSFLWSGRWLPLGSSNTWACPPGFGTGQCLHYSVWSFLGKREKCEKLPCQPAAWQNCLQGKNPNFIATQEFISPMNKEDKGVVRDKLCFGYWVHRSPTAAQG